jgi:hypothetical protein
MLGVGGILAAPPTGGLSLILTAGSALMLVWDGTDMGIDYFGSRSNRRRLRDLRSEAAELADEPAAINAELDRRSSA